jgi:hypothetical protein
MPPPVPPRLNADRWLVILLSLAGLWPFAPALLQGRVPGQQEVPIDGGNGLFIFSLVQEVLAGRASLLHADAMWFPTGRPFLLVVQNVLDATLAQPFLLALGPQLGLAVFAALLLVLNGLAAGWMGEKVGGRGWAGPAAAAVVALSPYVWAEEQTGRVTQTIVAPICLAVGASWGAVERGAGGARAGAWLAIAGVVYWFYGLFGAVLVAAVFLGGVVDTPQRWKTHARGLVTAAVVSALVAAPFVIFTAHSWGDMAGATHTESPVPNPTRVFGGLPWQRNPRIVAYIPQLTYVVGLIALLRAGRGRALGLAVATLLLVFTAHGRSVHVAGVEVPSPLALLQALPGFQRFWWPHRALAGATVALGALAAVAVREAGWLRRGALVLLLGVAAQGWWVPGVLSGWLVPPKPFWSRDVGPGALLFLPMLNPEVGKVWFAEWTWHRRPLVNGMSMWDEYLWPDSWRRWAESRPLVAALLDIERGRPHGRLRDAVPLSPAELAHLRDVVIPSITPSDLTALHDDGVDTVLVDKPRTPAASYDLLERLAGTPDCDTSERHCWWRLDTLTR